VRYKRKGCIINDYDTVNGVEFIEIVYYNSLQRKRLPLEEFRSKVLLDTNESLDKELEEYKLIYNVLQVVSQVDELHMKVYILNAALKKLEPESSTSYLDIALMKYNYGKPLI